MSGHVGIEPVERHGIKRADGARGMWKLKVKAGWCVPTSSPAKMRVGPHLALKDR